MRRLLLLVIPSIVSAQTPPGLAASRADFARWLETSPVSPFAAIYLQPLTGRLRFGPEGDPALAALPSGTLVEERSGLTLETDGGSRAVPRDRDVVLGEWHVRVSGPRGASTVTVFGPLPDRHAPGWFPFADSFVVHGVLDRAQRGDTRRLLTLDGVEVEATRAGTFVGTLGGRELRLVVYRMPVPGSEEADLTIFFNDETNGAGTYPAGRFLVLTPIGAGRYRADFNRARNPFCAYNSIFPCPAPWRGNAVPLPIEAGERYVPHGAAGSP